MEDIISVPLLGLANTPVDFYQLEEKLVIQQREVEFTIHELVKQNSLLYEVLKEVRKLSKYTVGEGNDIVERLMNKLDRNIISLESKKELEQQWTLVHAEFINLLKFRYPEFTCTECKIAALLKMKLTSSNISAVMFLSKRTVEFHRLNIRKKMRLNKDDDIHLALLELVND